MDDDFWAKEENVFKELGVDLAAKTRFSPTPLEPTSTSPRLSTGSLNSLCLSPTTSQNDLVKKWIADTEAEIARVEAEQVEKETIMRKQAKEELENWKKEREAMIKEKQQSAKKQLEQPKIEDQREIWANCLKFIETNSKFAKSSKDTSRIKSAIIKMKDKVAAS